MNKSVLKISMAILLLVIFLTLFTYNYSRTGDFLSGATTSQTGVAKVNFAKVIEPPTPPPSTGGGGGGGSKRVVKDKDLTEECIAPICEIERSETYRVEMPDQPVEEISPIIPPPTIQLERPIQTTTTQAKSPVMIYVLALLALLAIIFFIAYYYLSKNAETSKARKRKR